MNIQVGLDLSIRSTGIVIVRDGVPEYHIITDKLTRKQFQCNYINYHLYQKQVPEKDDIYQVKERFKTSNLFEIVDIIRQILSQAQLPPYTRVQIEGVAFGARGDVVGLAGLNYMVRMVLRDLNLIFNIISPMQLKKFAVGNGGAEKDIMVDAFQRCTRFDNPLGVKIDDIADAYFLAIYEG